MAERRTIGEILMGFGRIDESEMEQALAYQRDHGGYFGEALVGLGIVSEEELEWSLASQFDLPYVIPNADSIDPAAAGLVSPEWALAHLTLPIMRVGNVLTVVADSPNRAGAVDELSKRTGCEVELALAGASHIRELIRQVFSRAAAREDATPITPVSLVDGLRLALTAGAAEFGISTRGERSLFWYEDQGTTRRRLLLPRWADEMDELMTPPPSETVAGLTRTLFTARLNRDGIVGPADVRYLADSGGHEYLIRPRKQRPGLKDRFAAPDPEVLSEVRMLCRSGGARFLVTTDPEGLGEHLLPHLPDLLLDPNWRSVHIEASRQERDDGIFSVPLPSDPDEWAAELETLRAFRFDVVTVELTGDPGDGSLSAIDLAPVVFLRGKPGTGPDAADAADVRWELNISENANGDLEWSLAPFPA